MSRPGRHDFASQSTVQNWEHHFLLTASASLMTSSGSAAPDDGACTSEHHVFSTCPRSRGMHNT